MSKAKAQHIFGAASEGSKNEGLSAFRRKSQWFFLAVLKVTSYCDLLCERFRRERADSQGKIKMPAAKSKPLPGSGIGFKLI
jgi:hypothetical protein